ncbi:MAG: histidine phosphatase family protein [Actinobacteria bacterium]|nr:histidine phosphatase family protein [Actinomycetota bacterium]MCB9428568.1 histidine phosphatase family protein [Actinomycetota bacterium]HRV64998.1 histidine phosphatase family protein [Candidatus Nanopelagicales bacterium]
MAGIVILRHGQTEWSQSGQHTGRTDIPLTDVGRAAAAALAPQITGHTFAFVACSPLQRARETARLAGLTPDIYSDDLLEWDYGGYEGRTTEEIRRDTHDPDWVIWNAQIPVGETPGEQPEDVAVRCRRVLTVCEPHLAQGQDVALVAHGHLLRILTATWLGLEARDGRLFALATGTVSYLSYEREQHVIGLWNAPGLPASD